MERILLLRVHSPEQKDGYNEDGEYQLHCEEAENLADKASPDNDVLEVAYKFVGLFLR